MKFKELKNMLQTFDNGGYEDYVILDSVGNVVDCITVMDGYIVTGNDKAMEKSKKLKKLGNKKAL